MVYIFLAHNYNTNVIVHYRLIWVHLEQCALLIDSFSAKIQEQQKKDTKFNNKLRCLLNILMSQHISIQVKQYLSTYD